MTNLNIKLNRDSAIPLKDQLIEALKDYITQQERPFAHKLPSSRKLARQLGVSRIVTLTAYEQLLAEEFLISKPGSGTYINQAVKLSIEDRTAPINAYHGPEWFQEDSTAKDKEVDYDISFKLGQPTDQNFDEASWKRSWRHALSLPFTSSAPPEAGIIELRQAIADMVARNRGISCEADDIIITSGAVDIITLLARLFVPYKPEVCLENPGFPAALNIFKRYGHDIHPISVDQEGLIISDLPSTPKKPKLLFCTPSHQFPLGYRLSLPRRHGVMEWAREQDAVILEDDYDSEFRYDVAPLPPLKAQDTTGHVIYFSSLSKSLSPAVRLGYMIAPKTIRNALLAEIGKNHMQPPWLLQQAVAHFIRTGELDKHIRRIRRYYSRLNSALRHGLKNCPEDVKIHGMEAGLHCFVETPPRLNLIKAQHKILSNKVRCDSINNYFLSPSHRRGFVLGYGHLSTEDILKGLNHFTAALHEKP